MTQTMTEADARRILAEVEPKHAAWEREYSIFAGKGFVDLRPHLKGDPSTVPLADWRPRATRTPSGWAVSGGWLDEPVPPLPTRGVPNAGGVRCFVANTESQEATDAMSERGLHYFTTAGFTATEEVSTAIDSMRRTNTYVVSGWDMAYDWRRNQARYSATRNPARGWCAALGAHARIAKPGTLRGWQAMQRACDAIIAETDAAWAAERAELTQLTGAA